LKANFDHIKVSPDSQIPEPPERKQFLQSSSQLAKVSKAHLYLYLDDDERMFSMWSFLQQNHGKEVAKAGLEAMKTLLRVHEDSTSVKRVEGDKLQSLALCRRSPSLMQLLPDDMRMRRSTSQESIDVSGTGDHPPRGSSRRRSIDIDEEDLRGKLDLSKAKAIGGTQQELAPLLQCSSIKDRDKLFSANHMRRMRVLSDELAKWESESLFNVSGKPLNRLVDNGCLETLLSKENLHIDSLADSGDLVEDMAVVVVTPREDYGGWSRNVEEFMRRW